MASKRRPKTATLRTGMTYSEAAAAVEAAWPGLMFELFEPSGDYYHNSIFATTAQVAGDKVLGDPAAGERSLRVTASTTEKELLSFGMSAFGLAVVLMYRRYGAGANERPATVGELHALAEHYRAAFVAKNGREPHNGDSASLEGWFG
ncbi:hypothetical protein [Limnoglobus roseus]|uniref:Uncharacterized protein n=1 Tax=Limnoglobus roseus TaxID=2598579 RepID=A0A5C1AQL1_9BACT|nr:hypothetical protein [Limnoglobus roseus]QEL20905.1 hypothetical protein PX52LOC_08027 [Limnoglobus roseus]